MPWARSTGPETLAALTRLARSLVRIGPLRPESGWNAQHLSMMANALGKGEGPDIQQALTCLARALPGGGRLTADQGWAARHLATMSNGLGKGEGPLSQQALTGLAEQIGRRTLTMDNDWTAQHLAMTANGLSKGEGPRIEEALEHLAQQLVTRTLTADNDWTLRHLAMMANGLGKGKSAQVQQALNHLALAVVDQPWRGDSPWSPHDLAMLAYGLGKCEGPDIPKALTCLATRLPARGGGVEAVWSPGQLAMMIRGLCRGKSSQVRAALDKLAKATRDLSWQKKSAWSPGYLAMMAYGLGHSEGAEGQGALTALAQTLVRHWQLTPDEGWTGMDLSTLAWGLARGQGLEVQQALARLGRAVGQQDPGWLQGWATRSLTMMMESIGQAPGGAGVFGQLAWVLVQRALSEPQALVHILACLSRFVLSAAHLPSACRLLEALRAAAFRPDSRQQYRDLLWSSTLLHFASQQQTPVDQGLAAVFAQSFHHFLLCQPEGPGEGAVEQPCDDVWHSRWACDYWQPAATGPQDLPAPPASAPLAVSAVQQRVFDAMKARMPGHSLQMEVPVKDFPVDIMVDGRVCVEVDGPDHFVERLVDSLEPAGQALVRQRRTKEPVDRSYAAPVRLSGFFVLVWPRMRPDSRSWSGRC